MSSTQRVAARWINRVAGIGLLPKGVIIHDRGSRISLQSVPQDEYGQEYDVYILKGGAKAIVAAREFIEQWGDDLRKMSLLEAVSQIEHAVIKKTKTRPQWHSYSMPD